VVDSKTVSVWPGNIVEYKEHLRKVGEKAVKKSKAAFLAKFGSTGRK
jgi:hypothetical protein